TMILDGTINAADVNTGQIQIRTPAGLTCPAGQAIRQIDATGNVACEVDDVGVTAVSATAPLFSSGGTAPNISLPNVTIGSNNTAIGDSALFNNTGTNNTASGAVALMSNTTGSSNTASGFDALRTNTTGSNNTASGALALRSATGSNNIAIGSAAGISLTGGGNDNIYVGNPGAATE